MEYPYFEKVVNSALLGRDRRGDGLFFCLYRFCAYVTETEISSCLDCRKKVHTLTFDSKSATFIIVNNLSKRR